MVRPIERGLLYARTLRHLRWEQLVYRPIRRLQGSRPSRRVPTAQRDRAAEPRLTGAVYGWGPGDADSRMRRATQVMEGSFEFLGRTRALEGIDWTQRYESHLWSYHLHYFDYALDLAWAYRLTGDLGWVRRFEALATGWIRTTTAVGGDGWEPYPVSLRTVNWIYALLLVGEGVRPEVRAELENSLALQLHFLERRLEFHILANHLQKNAKALLVGGLYFAGRRAGRWRALGSRLLWREFVEQVLPDGGHYERSPMYHAIALGDVLEAISLLDAAGSAPLPQGVPERAGRMVDALAVLSRPDGSLHLFNDSANRIAPARGWLGAMAARVLGKGICDPSGVVTLPDTGYYGYVDRFAGERLVVDCGVPGPSYQPGHAHCDLLSFELDLADRPVIVDSGVAGYEADPLRSYIRSTRAHNTVSVGAMEQSEVWGTYRMARRARVLGATAELGSEGFTFSGAYRPYHDRSIVHRRQISRSDETRSWVIVDQLEGALGKRLTSFLHFHPDFLVTERGGIIVASAGACRVLVEPFGVDGVKIWRGSDEPAQGWYCPEFGVALPAAALELRVDAYQGADLGYRILVDQQT